MRYSVLMSVYQMDDPYFFEQAIDSMIKQTVPPDEIVLVCDGPLTPELDFVIQAYQETVKVVRLSENRGLGIALNNGIDQCRNELIARMDSDDISLPFRCEKELKAFEKNHELAIVSSSIEEFSSSGVKKGKQRNVPVSHDEIVRFSKKRCPFNHPVVMYRKSAVLSAGGYREDYHLFEDYDLWVRMLKNGAIGENSSDVLLKMRVSDDLYMRRGGREYACGLLRFHNHLRKIGWIGIGTFLTCAVPHAMVCILPNGLRKKVYQMLRKS